MPKKTNYEPVTRISREKQRNGDVYVWEKVTQYDPSLGHARVLSKKLLGKIPAGGTEMVETRYKAPADPNKVRNNTGEKPAAQEGDRPAGNAGQPSRRKKTNWQGICKHPDMMDILDFCGRTSGIDPALRAACSDAETAQKIISIARFLSATDGDALSRMETWQLNHPLPYPDRISEGTCANLFATLGNDDCAQQKYFSVMAQKQPSSAYLAYDVAVPLKSPSPFAESLSKTARALVLYSEDSGRPAACAKRQSGIPDIKSVEKVLRSMLFLNEDAVELIAGEEFYSPYNVAVLTRNAARFIMPAPNSVDWVRRQVDAHRAELTQISTICPFDHTLHGVTVPIEQTFQYMYCEKGRTRCENVPVQLSLHIFYDGSRAAAANAAFESQLYEIKDRLLEDPVMEALSPAEQDMANSYLWIRVDRRRAGGYNVSFNKKACEAVQAYQGFICLISNRETDPFEAWKKYRRRESIENTLAMGGGYDVPRNLRGRSADALAGRLFVQFIALSYREYYTALAEQAKRTLEEQLNSPETSKDEMGKFKELLAWVKDHSLSQQLAWFDAREIIEEHRGAAAQRWNKEVLEQDSCYLSLLGMKAAGI